MLKLLQIARSSHWAVVLCTAAWCHCRRRYLRSMDSCVSGTRCGDQQHQLWCVALCLLHSYHDPRPCGVGCCGQVVQEQGEGRARDISHIHRELLRSLNMHLCYVVTYMYIHVAIKKIHTALTAVYWIIPGTLHHYCMTGLTLSTLLLAIVPSGFTL